MAKHAHMYAVETPRLSLFSIQTAKPFLVEKSIIEKRVRDHMFKKLRENQWI